MTGGGLRAWIERADAFSRRPEVGRAAVRAGMVLLAATLVLFAVLLWGLASYGLPPGSRHLPYLLLAVGLVPALWGVLRVRRILGPEPGRGRARQALLDAARAGDPAACHALAEAYLRGGADQPRDEVSARHWMERAARDGHAPAMIGLARLLREGVGGPRDRAAADRWLAEARRRGAVRPGFRNGRDRP